MNPAFASIALAVFCCLSLFLYPSFLPSRSFADAPTVTPSITIGNSGSLAFSVDPGSFAYGRQDITVLTTNYTGYTLTAVPSSNDPRLANSVTGSYISSIASNTTQSGFSANEYGFSTDDTINSSTTYKPVTASTVIKTTNAATTTAQAGTFQLTIGAKAGSNAPAGTYSRTFTLTAAANPIAFAITYNANAGQDSVSNMPSPNPQTSGEVVGTTLTLSSSTPARSGYKFVGWGTSSSDLEPDYQPGDSYSLDQTTGNIATLYAIWAEPLQNWNGCNNLTVDTYKYLYDTRDNQIYKVSKYKMSLDGSKTACWMSNLNLGAEALVVNTLDSSNTHLPSNGSKDVPVTDSDTDSTNDFTSWIKSSGTLSYTDAELIPVTGQDNFNNKYSTLYNYCATTAGTICTNLNPYNASFDLCPSGWRLPTGNTSGEFQALTDANSIDSSTAGVTTLRRDFGFSLAGTFSDSTPNSQGSYGSYWSSTRVNNTHIYRLYFYPSGVSPANTNDRTFGRSIRCIKQAPTHTLTVSYGTGVTGVTIGGIAVANNSTLVLEEGVAYAINMTFDTDYDFLRWSTDSGTIASTSTQSTTYTIGNANATLRAQAKPTCVGKTFLYDLAACQMKGKNTDSTSGFSWTSITKPTTSGPVLDTSTSGVYEWDGKDGNAGVDSNGGNKKIYFFRGILDTTLASYGSNGAADAYPNYVKLANNTCWRIVRTTSTGGVKLIYNGLWNSSSNTCANTGGNAGTSYNGSYVIVPFNTTSTTKAGKTYYGLQYQNIQSIGYTYSNVPDGTTTLTPLSTLFGATGNDTTTNVKDSIAKQYIEDWYASNLTGYTSILEGDAGFCNDRTIGVGSSWTTPLADDYQIAPYGTSGMTEHYFGGFVRTITTVNTFNPLLTCPRGKVDLYSYKNSVGNGNGQLKYPVALLTSDEASLAGTGRNLDFNTFNANSYLRSGIATWLLSPLYQHESGRTSGIIIYPEGNIDGSNRVSYERSIRPSISLKYGVEKSSGSGTVTDPWVIAEPLKMQSVDTWASSVTTGTSTVAVDTRDDNTYTVSNIGGKLWMTQNLRITGTIPASGSNFTGSDFNVSAGQLTDSSCGNSSSTACSQIGYDGDGSPTTWYNFYATSAGTIDGNSNLNYPDDICPYGWRLPLSSESANLVNATSSDYSIFNATAGGYYAYSHINSSTHGYWWNSSIGASGNRYALVYDGSSLSSSPAKTYGTIAGMYIRCVKKNPTHTLTVSYSTGVSSVTINGQNVANNSTVTMEEGIRLSIDMSFENGYEFDSWSATSGTIGSASTQSTTYTIGSADATLTATAKASAPGLCTSTATCMQTATACDTTLTDARDGKTYTVATLNNQCWMTQNLAITGTISAEYSNFTSPSSFNVSEYDLETDGANSGPCASGDSSDPKGYTNVCSHYTSSDSNIGGVPNAWYNYAAATAGSIIDYSNGTAASSDICPSGWRLPTDSENYNLVTAIGDSGTGFNPVKGGYYINGSFRRASDGDWWSSTTSGTTGRHILDYSYDYLGANYVNNRYYGLYIRCVRSS